MKKYLVAALAMLLVGCSGADGSDATQAGTSGDQYVQPQAYYSTATDVVCFSGYSGSSSFSVSCLPASQVDLTSLKPNQWVFV